MTETTDRLRLIRETCRAPTQAAFAKWIGAASPQAVENWGKRDSVPKAQAIKIHDASGADLGWILSGRGEPFPNGPTYHPGADVLAAPQDEVIRRLEADVDQMRQAMLTFFRWASLRKPAAASELADLLREAPSVAQSAFRAQALDALSCSRKTASAPPDATNGGAPQSVVRRASTKP